MDKIIRAIARDAQIRISVASTNILVEHARQIHRTLPLATAALGRTLTAAAMIGKDLKSDNGSVTLQIKGNGPLGAIVAVADSNGCVRGYLQNPACELPLTPQGKLNVGAGVGQGYLMVIRDIGVGEPVSGTVALQNGEIAEDLTRYFAESEQVPTAVALGVLVSQNQSVKQAGGYLVQLMPDCKESDIERLEQNIAEAGAVTTMMEQGYSEKQIAETVLKGFDVEVLSQHNISYLCNCSRDKVTRALISLGREELTRLRDEEERFEVTCQFCDEVYPFTRQELDDILQKASTGKIKKEREKLN